MSTSCVNFTELRFTSDDAMQRYLADIETIWTPAVMEELAGLVLKRKSITRIWNHADQYKFSILWEYTSPAAYQKCQKVIAKRILPSAHRYEMVARAYRGVPIMDWRSDDASGLTVEGHLPRARTKAAISPTAPTPVTTRPIELAARRWRHMSISMTPSSFAARDWHRMIMLCCCFCDSTKSRCSMSPETTPHWHTPHNPSEHFTSTA